MKTLIKIMLLILFACNVSLAQKKEKSVKILSIIKLENHDRETITPYLIVKTKDIKSMDIISDSLRKHKYGAPDQTLIMRIVPNDNIKFIGFLEICKYFKVPQNYITNKVVSIDGVLVDHKFEIVADINAIISCVVNKSTNSIDITTDSTFKSSKKRVSNKTKMKIQ